MVLTVHRPSNLFALVLILFACTLADTALAQPEFDCPASWDDAGIPIPDPAPAPPTGTPEMTVDGLASFVSTNGLTTLAELLEVMPRAYRQNYALVETTRTPNPSSSEHPRLIHFGSDARFLMALGTDPNHAGREVVDIAELDDETGLWIFRSLDFGTAPPTLSADDSACVNCHGNPPRPIWGSYPSWPGMFGPTDDELTSPQAASLNHIRDTQALSDRFRHLEFYTNNFVAGTSFSLPGRAYPYTNTIFNMELGTAVADGMFRKVSRSPRFRTLRRELLLLSYCSSRVPDFWSTPAAAQITETMLGLGAAEVSDREIYRLAGADPDNDFSLHRLAFETPDPGWNVSTDDLAGLVDLLVLNELMLEDSDLRNLLASLPELVTGTSSGCFDDLEEAVRYKIYQGWTLRTEARQDARSVNFDVDLLRSHQGIFNQATEPLCNYLTEGVVAQPGLLFSDGFETGDLSAWTAVLP